MKAITIKKAGEPENLSISDIPIPGIRDDEVLVKVKAISVNPVDASVRRDEAMLHKMLKTVNGSDMYIIGWDISGTVAKTGKDVTGFKSGDDVFGMVNFPGNGKGYAGYLAAPAAHLTLKPPNVSHEEAAAATLAALTAWQTLVNLAKIRKGDRVLIHAASGGVGHYAVQIAKHFGAYVIGTASEENRDFVTKLGADEFVDYTSEKFENRVDNVDIVLDSIGGDHALRSMDTLRKGGMLILLKGTKEGPVENKAKDIGLNIHRYMVHSSGEDLKEIARLLQAGKIHSHVSKTYSFEEMPAAHRQIETRKTVGKIVVKVE